MIFIINVDVTKEDFEGEACGTEMARLFRKMAHKMEGLNCNAISVTLDNAPLTDILGNTVGKIEVIG